MNALLRLVPLLMAMVFAVAGAAAVGISMIASAGYYIILTGPIYLGVCGLPLLAAVGYTLESLLPRKILSRNIAGYCLILLCTAAILYVVSAIGLMLSSFINGAYLHWPVSDHHP